MERITLTEIERMVIMLTIARSDLSSKSFQWRLKIQNSDELFYHLFWAVNCLQCALCSFKHPSNLISIRDAHHTVITGINYKILFCKFTSKPSCKPVSGDAFRNFC